MRKPSEIKLTKYTLAEILERHLHWLNKDCDGWENMRADLSDANLSDADLRDANLSNAKLYKANLYNANLYNANLHSTDLSYAELRKADLSYTELSKADLHDAILHNADLCNTNLHGVNLRDADLSYANLHNANLCSTNLHNANLHGANLYNAYIYNTNLYNANLFNAKTIPYIPLACPSDGAFTAWKKIENYLIKLEIPASAKRCSATTQKCRASKAKVLGIYTLDGKKTGLKHILNTSQVKLDYIVGKTIYPDYYDEDRWNECSHGIHFFINKQDAINF